MVNSKRSNGWVREFQYIRSHLATRLVSTCFVLLERSRFDLCYDKLQRPSLWSFHSISDFHRFSKTSHHTRQSYSPFNVVYLRAP